MRSRDIAFMVATIAFSIAGTIVGTAYVVMEQGTERLRSCVEHGGSYVQVPNTARFECQGAMIHE